MPAHTFRTRVATLLASADVAINGDRLWDIRVHDERFYARVMAEGELGLGESYVDGWWDCERLDEFICRVLRADLRSRVRPWGDALRMLRAKLVNLQKPSRASHIGRHRDLDGAFDRVLSLGMFEHVGYKNYDRFMRIVRGCLANDGLFLLHTIGGNHSVTRTNPWIERYVFPNSMLPSAKQITAAVEGKFVIEDWHSLGADYDTTLIHWHQNFERHWTELRERYDERFHRGWRYFLLSSAGSFRARHNQVWQFVLSLAGVPSGYRAPR